MIRLLRRVWKYGAALLGRRFEDVADPEIQIEQAIEESKRQHRLLVEQAAAVIGTQRQLELKLGRTIDQVGSLRDSARRALELADDARAAAELDKADSYEDSARAFALSLVSSESEMRDLKDLHDRAITSATAAKQAVENNSFVLRQQLTERTRLLSQLQQTKLQERMNAAMDTVSGLAPNADVPSLERVRDKIEQRYSRALGFAEVGSSTVEARSIDIRREALELEATRQLDAIRRLLPAADADVDGGRRGRAIPG